jgi:hypothetical protein
MLLGRVGRFEAERGGNFCARGRGAGAGDGPLDKIEDLLLAISQFGSDLNDDSWSGGVTKVLVSYPVTVFLTSL